MNILFTSSFEKRFKKLDSRIKKITLAKIEFFKDDPLHPSLRIHSLKGELQGFCSISINDNYRIIFNRKNNGNIIFHFIGKHDVYKNL